MEARVCSGKRVVLSSLFWILVRFVMRCDVTEW